MKPIIPRPPTRPPTRRPPKSGKGITLILHRSVLQPLILFVPARITSVNLSFCHGRCFHLFVVFVLVLVLIALIARNQLFFTTTKLANKNIQAATLLNET